METPPLIDQRDQSPRHMGHPTRYLISSPTPPMSHGVNQGDYSTKTRAQHRKITSDDTRQRSYPSPNNYTLPYGNIPRTLPEPSYISLETSMMRRHSHQDQTRTPPNDSAEQRYLRPMGSTDRRNEKCEKNRNRERRSSDTRNAHRKRKTAATEETTTW